MLHVASPFQTEGTADQIITPALKGTEAVLKACRDFELKKCIFTSSIATVADGDNIKDIYNEDDWANENYRLASVYSKSKILAEKMVWDFRKNLKDSNLELVTINPGLVIGTTSLLNTKC
ncbi:MAG: SDR family oxidoreductase [Bacteroidota bacterium]